MNNPAQQQQEDYAPEHSMSGSNEYEPIVDNGQQDQPPGNVVQIQPVGGAPTGTPPGQTAEQMIPLSQVMQMMQAGGGFGQVPAQQQQAPAPVQMTPEQLAAHHKLFDPNDDIASELVAALSPDPATGQVNVAKATKFLKDFVTGIRTEHQRSLELYNESAREEIGQAIAPLHQHVSAQKKEAVWNEFSSMYPQLGNFRQWVDLAANAIGPTLPPGTPKAMAFQYVAQHVAQQLHQSGIQLPQVQSQQQRRGPAPTQQQQPVYQQSFIQPSMPFGGAPLIQGAPPRGGQRSTGNQGQNPFFDSDTFRS